MPNAPTAVGSDLTVADFDFELPPGAIAQHPASRRTEARLMLLPRRGVGGPGDARVADLPELVRGDELFVLNDTRVVPARLLGRKPTGGRVELLVLERTDDPGVVLAMGRASKALRRGTRVGLEDDHGTATLSIAEPLGDGHYQVRLPPEADDLWAFLDRWGSVPLPPYIERAGGPGDDDVDRYQTVFARARGSVAAPTAGLHFDEALLAALSGRGCQLARVTLHVGPGTFLPVRADRLSDHRMHHERYEVSPDAASAITAARAEDRPILAVGTTVVRTLEAVAAAHDGAVVAGAGSTDLFISPGYRFRVVDQLMTNFHLPRSTLLMLVSAFAGRDRTLAAYRAAVARGYRFFSYGDGMLIR